MQTSKLIPLSEQCLLGDDETVIARLTPIVRSVRIEIDRRERGFRLYGPVAPYYDLDPHLPAIMREMQIADPLNYRSQQALFDFCLEDSWSGLFMSSWCRSSGDHSDVVLVHLDDHTDMMSLFLECIDDTLQDPATGLPFYADSATDWELGIRSGSVAIGSFVTALYYGNRPLHVRHVNNFKTSTYRTYQVGRAVLSFPEIPGKQFATIRKRRRIVGETVGTYQGGIDPMKVLTNLPDGPVVVHIDLDYLINDFNGNPRTGPYSPSPSLRRAAIEKLDTFFAALVQLNVRVERWIVAASPGFCSALHWAYLMGALETRIADLRTAP